jgi:hypothetical protein
MTFNLVIEKMFTYCSKTVLTYRVNMTLTFDAKNNRGYLLAKTKAPVKFEGKGQMTC